MNYIIVVERYIKCEYINISLTHGIYLTTHSISIMSRLSLIVSQTSATLAKYLENEKCTNIYNTKQDLLDAP